MDDEDFGSVVIYTGAGGNERTSGRQVADQTLTRTNRALVENLRTGLPVRVVRGSHPDVHQGPVSGYRYDGLYRVANYWAESGRDGFRVWRFRLEALEGEALIGGRVSEQPDPWNASPERRTTVVSRIVRDSAVTRRVKSLHAHRCQVCGERIETPTGPFVEAAHIRPLGRPHDGPDTLDNVLCLCPTHHAAFDLYAFAIEDDGTLIGEPGRLRVHPSHVPSAEHIGYHREQYRRANGSS